MNELINKIKVLLAQLPKVNPREVHSVQMIFADGEQCYTKAGDIFGQRSLHQFYPEASLSAELKEILQTQIEWPDSYNGYKCVFYVDPDCNNKVAHELRDTIHQLAVG